LGGSGDAVRGGWASSGGVGIEGDPRPRRDRRSAPRSPGSVANDRERVRRLILGAGIRPASGPGSRSAPYAPAVESAQDLEPDASGAGLGRGRRRGPGAGFFPAQGVVGRRSLLGYRDQGACDEPAFRAVGTRWGRCAGVARDRSFRTLRHGLGGSRYLGVPRTMNDAVFAASFRKVRGEGPVRTQETRCRLSYAMLEGTLGVVCSGPSGPGLFERPRGGG
jgi:hypothetical protein